MAETRRASATTEHHGPLDLRAIRPDDIGEARERIAGLLRDVKARDGHRAAITAGLAAVASAVDVLTELGAEAAALSALRMCLASLEHREICRTAGAHGETRH